MSLLSRKISFADAYNKLSRNQRKLVRTYIMSKCNWQSDATFYFKKDGKIKIRKTEMSIIREIFKKYNLRIRGLNHSMFITFQ